MLVLMHFEVIRGDLLLGLSSKATWSYLAVIVIMILNSLLMSLMDLWAVGEEQESSSEGLVPGFAGSFVLYRRDYRHRDHDR
jgi:hypothetical protein